jgi:hypothetical protein
MNTLLRYLIKEKAFWLHFSLIALQTATVSTPPQLVSPPGKSIRKMGDKWF